MACPCVLSMGMQWRELNCCSSVRVSEMLSEDRSANSWAKFFTDFLSSFSADRGREVNADKNKRREEISDRDASWVLSWDSELSRVATNLHGVASHPLQEAPTGLR